MVDESILFYSHCFLVCRLEYFKNPSSSSASTGGVCLEAEDPPSMSDRSGAYVLHKTVTVSQVHLTQSHNHTMIFWDEAKLS